jgi:hypothetical protein
MSKSMARRGRRTSNRMWRLPVDGLDREQIHTALDGCHQRGRATSADGANG